MTRALTTLPTRQLRRGRVGAIGAGIGLALLVPSLALAHPLGNFTINHYAGIRVESDRLILDIVIDQAEIPTFQEKLRIDTDGDGTVSDAEAEVERRSACPILASSLDLTANGRTLTLTPEAAGLTFPPGAAGLETMRLVCTYTAPLAAPLAGTTTIAFADASHQERIGWREITAQGSGVTIGAGSPPTASVSSRLTLYPTSMLTTPLDVRSGSFLVSPGGPILPPFAAPDATLLPGAAPLYAPVSGATAGPAASAPPVAETSANGGAASVPGGVGGDISGLLQTQDLTPLVLIGSILAAMVLGAGHAVTPGHGKTLMGAYLVGTRGTPLHAVALGLSVTVSHTLGIVVLAAIVIGFRGALPPETFNRLAPIASGLLVLGIGAWLLISQLRARRTARALAAAHAVAADGGATSHDHAHGEGAHDHDADPGVAGAAAHDHDAGEPDDADGGAGIHSHGGIRHSHLPAATGTLTWRSLFVLGLAGGIIPSTNALIILLATIATGRAVYGLVLVVAFGLGMAVVLGGVGLGLVLARDRLDRLPSRSSLGRFASYAPLMAGVVVFALGIYLTTQAVGVAPTL